MKKREIAIRYSIPQKYDNAPYMTIVKVVMGLGDGKEEYKHYVQASSDEEKTKWMSIGEFLEEAFEESFTNKRFIKEITHLHELKNIKKD